MLLLLKQVKIVVQYPTTNVSLFFNDRCKEAIYKREEKDDNGVIRPNDLIYLHGDDCVKKSLYQIVTYDEESNAFVLRIIDALPSVVYPLNETLCKRMGIEYEKNLVMLPANIEWKKHREEIDCSAEITNDLGTYPSYKGYIKHVFLKLSGCESIDSTYIKMPNGHEYSKYDISRQLKVRSLAQLGMFNSRNVGGLLSHSIVTSIFGNFEGYSGSLSRENHNTICDRNGDIYIYLDLSSLNLTKQDVEFNEELRKKLGITSSASSALIDDDRLNQIYEYCIEKIIRKQAEDFYKDFPITAIVSTLIDDYVRMESFRRKDSFGDFCLALYQQIECVTH